MRTVSTRMLIVLRMGTAKTKQSFCRSNDGNAERARARDSSAVRGLCGCLPVALLVASDVHRRREAVGARVAPLRLVARVRVRHGAVLRVVLVRRIRQVQNLDRLAAE